MSGSAARTMDCTHVDVANMSNETIDHIDESGINPYSLPLSTTNAYHMNYNPQDATTASSVNAIYPWPTRYISTLQNGTKTAKHGDVCSDTVDNFPPSHSAAHTGIGMNFNRGDCIEHPSDHRMPQASYDHCAIANQMYTPYSTSIRGSTACPTYQNHPHQYNGLLKWPYS